MKERNVGNFVFTLVNTVFIVSLIVACQNYRFRLQIVPILVGIPTLFMFLLIFVKDILNGTEKLEVEGFSIKRLGIVTGWILLFCLLIFVVGFFVATPLYMLLFFYIETRLEFVRALGLSLALSLSIWGMFYFILKTDLWPGIILSIIPGIIGGGSLPPL